MAKVLFLDVDGPLCSARSITAFGYSGNCAKGFDPVAVGLINDLIERFGYTVVISSTWACHGKEKITEILQDAGLVFELHEDWITPRKFSSQRASEINWWLEDHPECEDFLVVDDATVEFFEEKKGLVLKINAQEGFSWGDYIKVFEHHGAKIPFFLI